MSYSSTLHFVERLEKEGELLRIKDPIQTELEITALADREMKSHDGGKALLIEKPQLPDGTISKFPLLINAWGSEKRMALSLNTDHIDSIAEEIGKLLKAKPPQSFRETWDLLGQGINLLHARPKKVTKGGCQDHVHYLEGDKKSSAAVTLRDLPILKCWPEDGGAFITLPHVHTKDSESGVRNVGMYRMQVFDETTTAMHWQLHKVGARHGEQYRKSGERMPVAVSLGGDPALTFAASAPLPDGLDEILLAGFLSKKAVEMVACKTVPLEVPASADFVLEGYVDFSEPLRDEGPFGDHTGFYTPVDSYPAFHITALTHRDNAIYPCTIVGKPPMEDFYLGSASVRVFLPIFKMNFPEIVDIALPAEGVFHNLVFVSINKQYPYQSYKVMHALWGMGQMMFSKIIVVVDGDVDVHNTSEVLFYLCSHIDPKRDVTFTKNPYDALDHASSRVNVGSHVGFDATRKLKGEGYARQWPEEVSLPQSVLESVKSRFPQR